jgi:hypothetical protein
MTTLKWDHAVQFVNQPDEAIATFAGQGLNAFAGGRPPGWEPGMRSVISGLPSSSFSPFTIMLGWLRRRPFLLSGDAAQLLPEKAICILR